MYSYSIKVRAKSYLWGSDGIVVPLSAPALLIIRNDPQGDPISLGSDNSTATTTLGTLQPGECWTVPLFGLRGVHATCTADSTVNCTILVSNVPPMT